VTFDLVLVGFGHVTRRFVGLLAEYRSDLLRQHGITTRVVGIGTRRHGCAYAAEGLDAEGLAGNQRDRPIGEPFDGPTIDFVTQSVRKAAAAAHEGRLVVVEATTLDIGRGEPATGHIRAAIEGGAHVVTCNKGPVAFAYRQLAIAAERAGRRLLFEGTVMDGVPIFNLARETLPAVTVVGFRGVVNSTTNYILTAMEQGQPFAEALAEMQAMGVAEANASLDIDGWDAAAKTAALANVLLGASMTPHDVERRGITEETGRRAVEARAAGRRLKLVARAGREGSVIAARVAPEELPEEDLLAGLEGRQNALILHTDLLDEIAVVQRSASLTQTAYALLSDLITIARDTPQSLRQGQQGHTL
jgi:homoserine dehydrogenase